jgi:cobalt-zinc-cadmium efflux system outer membrane protein
MKTKHALVQIKYVRLLSAATAAFSCGLCAHPVFAQGAVKITIDEAIQLALRHNHNLQAARTTIQQSQAAEVTANLRPNPEFFVDWEYLPLFSRPEGGVASYLQSSTEGDMGLSYLIERGKKRARRWQAAKDVTAQTRSLVADNERTLTFQVASLFVNVQLAESTLDVTEQNLKSFQNTVDIGETQFRSGALSENDYLKIKLQLLQFQTDHESAQLARVQALSDLRQQIGYESVTADYGIIGQLEYTPVRVTLESLQMEALENRPDLRAAHEGVTAAGSQYELAKANGKQDVTLSANYSHVNGINGSTFLASVPLAIFNRNQGEIARMRVAINQAQEQQIAARGQVLTDVKDAYEGLQTNFRVVDFYRSGYLEVSQKNRDISEYAYQRGAASLLDFLDAERSYRATQLNYRQALAAYVQSLEQLRQAVGTRSLP